MALDLNISKQILQATVVSIILLTSVDPDPDSGCEKIRSGSGVNFDTDPDPAIFYADPDPGKRYGFHGSGFGSGSATLVGKNAFIQLSIFFVSVSEFQSRIWSDHWFVRNTHRH